MKLLLNDKEIVNFLLKLIDYWPYVNEIQLQDSCLRESLEWANERKDNLNKFRDKIKTKIRQGVKQDLRKYVDKIKINLEDRKKFYSRNIHKNLNYIVESLGEEKIFNAYKNSKYHGFVKSTGLSIDSTSNLVRRNKFDNFQEDCLLRNTVGNEQFLISKIDNKLPFWFIDSGYTNFIESNKKWHRLVRNHLHTGKYVNAPVDRLSMFKTFPRQWRTGGDKILVIEPGIFAANIFHINIEQWKKQIQEELSKYTDKKIIFREKAPKKKRESLYKHLLDEEYYCVININSNAATEAIWAGVPVITLDQHISNSVTRSKISDINNLYRGNLADWLCMLSYSQFTYDELINGTAAKIIKQYHV